MKVIEDVINALLEKNMQVSYRLCKVIELTEEEAKAISVDNGYLFWCFIHLERKKPIFLFAQFCIGENEVIWSYRLMKFHQWAKKANKRGWFDRLDVRNMFVENHL
jgi:hypothetical protein